MTLKLGPTDTAAGDAPAGSASRSPLPLFAALCVVFSALMHAGSLAAADLHLHQSFVAGAVFSVAALFNLAILSLNFIVARRPPAAGPTTATAGAAPEPTASASRSRRLACFIGLFLLMGAALHAGQLADAAKQYQIHPVVVAGVVLAGAALFHFAVLSLHRSLAHHQAEDQPKQLRRSRGRVPLLPFVVLALAIPTAASAEAVMVAGATDLAQDASIWALLALAVSFNIAIGSLYCFVIAGPPPPAATDVQPRLWSKVSGAMVSCTIAAGVLVSCMLLANGGASGETPACS